MINSVLHAEGAAQNPLLPAIPDLFWSSVVFVILLTFFWIKVLPNFKKTLDARTEAIEGRLAEAERIQAEVAQKTADIAEAQENSRAEASAIREAARAEGVAILAELKDQASADAAAITAKAHQQIEAERLAAIQSLRSEVGQLALDLAGRVIGEQVKDSKSSSAVVDRFLADIEKNEKSK